MTDGKTKEKTRWNAHVRGLEHICAVKYIYFPDANTVLNGKIFVISWLYVDILHRTKNIFILVFTGKDSVRLMS